MYDISIDMLLAKSLIDICRKISNIRLTLPRSSEMSNFSRPLQ